VEFRQAAKYQMNMLKTQAFHTLLSVRAGDLPLC